MDKYRGLAIPMLKINKEVVTFRSIEFMRFTLCAKSACEPIVCSQCIYTEKNKLHYYDMVEGVPE